MCQEKYRHNHAKNMTLSDKPPKRTLSETSTTFQELQVEQFRNKFMIMLGYTPRIIFFQCEF